MIRPRVDDRAIPVDQIARGAALKARNSAQERHAFEGRFDAARALRDGDEVIVKAAHDRVIGPTALVAIAPQDCILALNVGRRARYSRLLLIPALTVRDGKCKLLLEVYVRV